LRSFLNSLPAGCDEMPVKVRVEAGQPLLLNRQDLTCRYGEGSRTELILGGVTEPPLPERGER
jgi:hypothetical protein